MDKNRLKALQVIDSVIAKRMKTKDALSGVLNDQTPERDRSFVMEIAYGCIRHKLFLEFILSAFVKKFRGKEETRINLLMGIYQLRFMRVSDWAAVNEAVELEKFFGGNPSFVNAVLRNYIRKKQSIVPPPFEQNPLGHISISTSHPEWLITRWIDRFGAETARRLAESNNRIPPLAIRVNTLRCSMEQVIGILEERRIAFSHSEFSPEGLILKGIPFSALSGMEGCFAVQDEAAQIVSHLLAPQPGEDILDACAAPGGKSTHIAQLTKNRARIVAVEADASRVGRLRQNIERLGADSVAVVNSDILAFSPEKEFDRILVDAPCSSLGVVRRNPDVKYRHNPFVLKEFGSKQVEILGRAASLLKRGTGLLVYSVCSTEPEETIEVVAGFLNKNSDFYIIKNAEKSEMPESFFNHVSRFITKEGFMFTYPYLNDMDGFFAARFGRK